MRSFFLFVLGLTLQLSAAEHTGFVRKKNEAQYKGSSYENVVQVASHVTLDQAFDIAESNPDVDYFVYVKGHQMVLEVPSEILFDSPDPFGLVSYMPRLGYCRIFKHGDAVFFKKEGMWLGSAPGLADTYLKSANF